MPSLYEATANTGEVSSSNFTTLYNASGLEVPNAGAGSITGNLNVGGNLTVQGSSLFVGAVTLQSTLSLPNYQFPTPDGATDQVLTTNGAGELSWQDVNALPGATYNIEANTTTGGANLTLFNDAGDTDSVKFASGTNITVTRTDANTITISTIADNIPDGTAAGQVLEWDGSAWTANNVVTTLTPTGRLVAEYKDNTTNIVSSFGVRRNTGSTPFTTGTISSSIYQLDSDSQPVTSFGSMGFAYDASNPIFAVATSTDNFSTRTFITNIDKTDVKFNGTNLTLNANGTASAGVNASLTVERGTSGADATITWNNTNTRWELSNDAQVAGDLAVNGGDITTTSTTGNLFNTNATVVNIGDAATTEVNLGSAVSGRVQIKPNTIVGANTTQNVFNTTATTVNAFGAATGLTMGATTGTMTLRNPTIVGTQTTQNLFNTVATTVNAFGAATAINMGAATGTTTIGHNLSVNGEILKVNADNTAADSFVYMKGTNEYLKWNNTDTRFEFSDQLYISETDVPGIFERRVLAADVSPSEAKGALRLFERVTDVASNANDYAGPAVVFGRTWGASGGDERLFANMGSVWYGTTNKAKLQFNWSTDNYTEPTPGVFPQTYTLLSLASDDATFFNNSLYVDYAYVDSTKTATSITGGNTLVFGSAHGYTAGSRILYQTATQNGLTQSTYYYVLATGLTTTQCQVSTQAGGTAATLTNGTGLTLTFATVSNRVGVNTTSPGYTLDVSGDANVTGDIYVSGVHVDLATPVHQGQMLYVSNDVTPTITNSSTIVANAAAYRPVFQYDNTGAGANSAIFLRKNYGASTYTTNDGVGLAFQLNSDTQATNQFASVIAQWNASAPFISLNTNINNNTAGPFDSVGIFSTVQATLPGNLEIDGNNIKKSGGTTVITFSGTNLTTLAGDLQVDGNSIRGSTGVDAIEISGANITVAGNADAASYTIDNTRAKIDTGNSATWATGTTITLTTTDKNLEKAMFYITDGTNVHALEALVLRNGATAMLTTYGEMYSSTALATFTADISAGALRIRGTNTTATTLTVSVVGTTLL